MTFIQFVDKHFEPIVGVLVILAVYSFCYLSSRLERR